MAVTLVVTLALRRSFSLLALPWLVGPDMAPLVMALCLYRQKAVRFGKSKIHRWGVFAAEALRKDDMLLEYRGEAIGNAVAEIREKVRRTHP